MSIDWIIRLSYEQKQQIDQFFFSLFQKLLRKEVVHIRIPLNASHLIADANHVIPSEHSLSLSIVTQGSFIIDLSTSCDSHWRQTRFICYSRISMRVLISISESQRRFIFSIRFRLNKMCNLWSVFFFSLLWISFAIVLIFKVFDFSSILHKLIALPNYC